MVTAENKYEDTLIKEMLSKDFPGSVINTVILATRLDRNLKKPMAEIVKNNSEAKAVSRAIQPLIRDL